MTIHSQHTHTHSNLPISNTQPCRYGSMSALRLHMAMKHSLKRSLPGHVTDQPLQSMSYDCGLGKILPDMATHFDTPMPLPPTPYSPLIDRFLHRSGLESSSCSDFSPSLHRGDAWPVRVSSGLAQVPERHAGLQSFNMTSPPDTLDSASCPDFLSWSGVGKLGSFMNNNDWPRGNNPFAMEGLAQSLVPGRGGYVQDDVIDVEKILSIFDTDTHAPHHTNHSAHAHFHHTNFYSPQPRFTLRPKSPTPPAFMPQPTHTHKLGSQLLGHTLHHSFDSFAANQSYSEAPNEMLYTNFMDTCDHVGQGTNQEGLGGAFPEDMFFSVPMDGLLQAQYRAEC